MTDQFFQGPILNGPYQAPTRHWELDADGQPTGRIVDLRRRSDNVTPIPQPKKKARQANLELGMDEAGQRYDPTPVINQIREAVARWRQLPPEDWGVTYETQVLLQHWRRQHDGIRPFFCQIEAVETVIWLTEVAGQRTSEGRKFWEFVRGSNQASNPDLMRLAMKLATGAGKTTVMAMIIAWQTINAMRHPNSKLFTKGFLVVTPGVTIRDRLQVLRPQDPNSYYIRFGLVPDEMKRDMNSAVVVITNYHAFQRRDNSGLTSFGRKFLQAGDTAETEGQMVQRVCSELANIRNVVVINDEAHHCYREKPHSDDDLKGEDKEEAKRNSEAARLWISGVEAVKRQYGVRVVYDLSATPFYLKGSGYKEGTIFGWTVSDFSLMDAIECGIVKLPRVPITDNDPEADTPRFRDIWKAIGKDLPKSKGKADPEHLPPTLISAIESLYGHYSKTYDAWSSKGIEVPPVFIIVCNNTTTSKMVYDYIAGYPLGETGLNRPGRLKLFSNYAEDGTRHQHMRTLLIDSNQLESDQPLEKTFRDTFATEIDLFRQEHIARTGDAKAAAKLDDRLLLREVMNTVGQVGKLGAHIRCVISVSMLTEGWDANTVTHIMGVRAFGSQLLCEQVVGRALRRLSYALDENERFGVEYADILGIPFDFTAKAVEAPVVPPAKTLKVFAMPERAHAEIVFPRVEGYSIVHPQAPMRAEFNHDSTLRLNADLVGPSITKNAGIIGDAVDLTMDNADQRRARIAYEIASALVMRHYKDGTGQPEYHRFGQIKRIVDRWLAEGRLVCSDGHFEGQVLYPEILENAAEKIKAAITRAAAADEGPSFIRAHLNQFEDTGTTADVNFVTTDRDHWDTNDRCHVNRAILDSGWEGQLCGILEDHPRVLAYVKNHNLGFWVPYLKDAEKSRYFPDYIVRIDIGDGEVLNLVVEVKGERKIDAELKADAIREYWIPGVNNHGRFGRWAFVELTSKHTMASDLDAAIAKHITAEAA